jgi:NADH:ubiquinone oxidoreductase subunit K
MIINFYSFTLTDITLHFIIINALIIIALAFCSLLIKEYNFITLLLTIEIIIISLITILLAMYNITQDLTLLIYILCILGVVAVETGVILALIVKYYQRNNHTILENIKYLKY